MLSRNTIFKTAITMINFSIGFYINDIHNYDYESVKLLAPIGLPFNYGKL